MKRLPLAGKFLSALAVLLLVCYPSFAQGKMLPEHLSALATRVLDSNTDLLGRQALLAGEPSFLQNPVQALSPTKFAMMRVCPYDLTKCMSLS